VFCQANRIELCLFGSFFNISAAFMRNSQEIGCNFSQKYQPAQCRARISAICNVRPAQSQTNKAAASAAAANAKARKTGLRQSAYYARLGFYSKA
jgi:hypothetical protein